MDDMNRQIIPQPASSPDIRAPRGLGREHEDTAARSLSDALRWSFAILSVAMIVVIGAWFFTGFKQVNENQAGVVTVLGRLTRTVGPGLAVTWPEPIGRVQTVVTSPQTLVLEDFWFYERPEEKTQADLSKKSASLSGLRPGWDGALLTADSNLLHVRFNVSYRIDNVEDFFSHMPSSYVVLDPASGAPRLDEPIRSAVCKAAIRTAAGWIAETIRVNPGAFSSQVLAEAQRALDASAVGIRIENLTIPSESITWPLAVRPSFDAAMAAGSKRQALIEAAKSDANNILSAAAGQEYWRLVDAEKILGEAVKGLSPEDTLRRKTQGDLIYRYDKALASGDKAQADTLLSEIDDLLVSRQMSGRVNKLIEEAASYRTKTQKKLEGRARRFSELKDEYVKNPQFLRDREWASVWQEILSSPTVSKTFLDTENGKVNLFINLDPTVARQIEDYLQENPPPKVAESTDDLEKALKRETKPEELTEPAAP